MPFISWQKTQVGEGGSRWVGYLPGVVLGHDVIFLALEVVVEGELPTVLHDEVDVVGAGEVGEELDYILMVDRPKKFDLPFQHPTT